MTFDPYHVTNHSPFSRENYASRHGANNNTYHHRQSRPQGAPSPHPERAPPLKLLAHTPVTVSRPPTPVPPTQFATDPTITTATSVSLHYGRAPAIQASGTARVTPSFPAFPKASNPSISSHQQREKWVGDQLQMIIDSATAERNKAAQIGE